MRFFELYSSVFYKNSTFSRFESNWIFDVGIKDVALGQADLQGHVRFCASYKVSHPTILPTAIKFYTATSYQAGKLTTPPLLG